MSEEYSKEEFLELATAEFGDKITCATLKATPEALEHLNSKTTPRNPEKITLEDLEAYGIQAWIGTNKCPRCDHDLGGLFGSFQWALQHGVGYCSNCGNEKRSVRIRLYHYVKEGAPAITAPALIGF